MKMRAATPRWPAPGSTSPAVERVWSDEMAAIRRDLDAWLEHLARDGAEWKPTFFELAFGKVPGERPWAERAEKELRGKGKSSDGKRYAALHEALRRAKGLEEEGKKREAETIRRGLAELYRDDATAQAILQGR